MPYFINTWSIPKPGNLQQVLSQQKVILAASGHSSNLTVTLSPPSPLAHSTLVIGTIGGFESLADVEVFDDRFFKDPDGLPIFDGVNSLCSHSNISISEVLHTSSGEPLADPKFVKRDFITPAPGALLDLVSELKHWSEEAQAPIFWVISRGVPGLSSSDVLRVSHFAASLQDLEDFNSNEIRGNPRLKRFGELVSGPPRRGTSRVVSVNRGENSSSHGQD